MKKDRLKQLFTAAARVEAPAGTGDLSTDVLRAIDREVMLPERSWFEQLGQLWPRIALASVVLLAVCALWEYSAREDLSTDIVQASEQWLFTTN